MTFAKILRSLCLLLFLIACSSELLLIQGCTDEREFNKTIDFYGTSGRSACWQVHVPNQHFIRLKILLFETSYYSGFICNYINVKFTATETDKNYIFCPKSKPDAVIEKSDVVINLVEDYGNIWTSLKVSYEIEHIECMTNNSFRCSPHFCIPSDQVCDGVSQCDDGQDEVGCVIRVVAIKGVKAARNRTVSWLKRQRTRDGGWREHTARAVVAMHLGSGMVFGNESLEARLTAKQMELKASLALLRPPIPSSQLSMIIHALIVTCRNPRRFYGYNLVKTLKDQVSIQKNYTDPVNYLALCNAGEEWPVKAEDDLMKVFNDTLDYPFNTDVSAVAALAVSCAMNNATIHKALGPELLEQHQSAIKEFKSFQNQDGSFGSLYTTALVTQVLMASGEENSPDWNANATIQFLMNEMNQTSVDMLATYYTLPIFNGKTLVDISKENCSKNRKNNEDWEQPEEEDYVGPKQRIQYSLYIGDERDVVLTMSLRVPLNSTAFQVMELAAREDPKYKFSWKLMKSKMYIYTINKITNDPEMGTFWLLYVADTATSTVLKHSTESPDNIILSGDGQHLIMWYKNLVNKMEDSELEIMAAMNTTNLISH